MSRSIAHALGTALALLTAPLHAADYMPSFTSVDYTSTNVTVKHAHQKMALFTPLGTPPAAGWPVVVHVFNSQLTSTDACFDDPIGVSAFYAFLDAGFAVVRAALTTSDSYGQSGCVAYPDLSGKGNGLFHPPGEVPTGLTRPPYSDLDRPMAEKDCVMLVQHLKYEATTYGIDPDRIYLFGRSGGGVIAMWCAAGPDRSDLFEDPVGQDEMDTRPAGVIVRGSPLSWPALVATTASVPHWPLPTSGPAYETPNGPLGDVPTSILEQSSPLYYQTEARALNDAQRFYLCYADPSQTTELDYTLVRNEIIGHSSWFGYAWREVYDQSRLVITNTNGIIPGAPAPCATILQDEGRLVLDMITWLRDEPQGEGAVHHPYDDGLGKPVATGHRTPVLTGHGTFTTTSGPIVALSHANPDATALVFFHDTYAETSFLGGTLGPTLQFMPVEIELDAQGTFKRALPPDLLGPNESLYFQAWIVDSGGPQGFTASNTIRVDG